MTIKTKTGKDNILLSYLKLSVVVILGFLISWGLGEYTSYLADVAHTAPDKSMKEVISGFGSLIFGLFTISFSGLSLLGLGWLVYGIFNPSFITLEECK